MAVQVIGEFDHYFTFAASRCDHVKIVRADHPAAKKFQSARHHARKLCRPFDHRQNANQFPAFARCDNGKPPAVRHVFPPGRQPLMRQEDKIGPAGFEKCIPFTTKLEEFVSGLDDC